MMRKILLLVLLISCFSIYGRIIEAEHFKDIFFHLKEETLVVLDIDDTLLVPVQMLGCDEWFQSRLKVHQKEGASLCESLEMSLAEWEAVRHLTKMEIVEPGNEKIVSSIQAQGYAVIGLTTQGLALAERTVQQLMAQQIDLSKSAPSSEELYFSQDNQGVLFRRGILFTAGSHKGKALFHVLDQLNYLPKRVVFINDKYSHLVPVEEVAQQKGVEFIGLRYAFSDIRKAAFSESIADYQFRNSTFSHILSDKEAQEQLTLK